MKKSVATFLMLLVLPLAAWANDPPKKPAARSRGRVNPPALVLKARHEAAARRNGKRVMLLPKATPEAFDCRTLGWVGPVLDQGNCGSCWDVSACGVISNGFIKAGLAKNDGSFLVSPQFVLDNCLYVSGQCDGDDAVNVLENCKSKGIPLESDYGPYTAKPGTCKDKPGYKRYKVADWGYCTPGQAQGIASTQDIKNCIVRFGSVSTAVAANEDWDAYKAGVIPFRKLTPNDVNHDVAFVGWDDTKAVEGAEGKGAWLVMNQWSKEWGDGGFIWVGYGSHQIGTEAAWVSVAQAPIPPPDPPTPPDPPVNNVKQQVDALFAALEAKYARRPFIVHSIQLVQGLVDVYLETHPAVAGLTVKQAVDKAFDWIASKQKNFYVIMALHTVQALVDAWLDSHPNFGG